MQLCQPGNQNDVYTNEKLIRMAYFEVATNNWVKCIDFDFLFWKDVIVSAETVLKKLLNFVNTNFSFD